MQTTRPSSFPLVHTVFPVLVFFLAAIFSGVLEKLPVLNGLHILTILGGAALLVIAISGRLRVVMEHPISKCLVWFSAWMVVCVPFAAWPGGSVALILNVWSKAALSYVLVAGCILTIKQSKTIFNTMAYSIAVLTIITLALGGHDRTGRLGLLDTRYDNANDLGWNLIVGLSFFTFVYARGSRWQRYSAVILSVPILYALVKTGSRGGMLGFGMLLIFGYMQAPRSTKLKLGVAAPVLALVLLAVTPKELRMRYTTVFGEGEAATPSGVFLTPEQRIMVTATQSAEERWQLLKDSIHLTLTHPLFGVGPADFQVAQADLAKDRGDIRGSWHVTHNTYTQISSEMGIPGLVIYLAFLFQSFKSLNTVVRTRYRGSAWEDLRAMAKSLRATLLMLMVVAAFGSFGYDTNIPILAGMACAISLIAERQRLLLQTVPQGAAVLDMPVEPALEPVWTPTTV